MDVSVKSAFKTLYKAIANVSDSFYRYVVLPATYASKDRVTVTGTYSAYKRGKSVNIFVLVPTTLLFRSSVRAHPIEKCRIYRSTRYIQTKFS